MPPLPHDSPPLADREALKDALSRICETDINHDELTNMLRAVTGWNMRTCARFASEKLPLDDRRRDNLVESISDHARAMEALKQWLNSLSPTGE